MAHSSATDKAWVTILSNHPRLEWTERMAMGLGPFTVQMQGARLIETTGCEFIFAPHGETTQPRRIVITNDSGTAQSVRVKWQEHDGRTSQGRVLAPGETWEIGAPFPTKSS